MNTNPIFRRIVPALVVCATLLTTPTLLATDYLIGPGQPYTTISDAPLHALTAGDTVLIHWRAEPYKEKFVIVAQGDQADPITIRGVLDPDGRRPVIDGEDATTHPAQDYWNEVRSVVKIGGSSTPPNVMPTYIVVENLDIRGARNTNTFTDDHGATETYANNAAAIHIERGEHITIRNCIIRDSGNGLFVSSSESEVARDILIEGNYIHSNGNVGRIYEHNTYTAALGIVYQFNRFGPLLSGAGGNNLKDRSAGLVVRHNWIEGGNRQLDLVDAEDSGIIRDDPSYNTTYVYGNVLIEPEDEGNRQIVHYGGDSGATGAYRKGMLYFYHNTMISHRAERTTLMRLSTNDEHCDARNNILFVPGDGSGLAIVDETGILDLSHNWIKPGWRGSFGTVTGSINDDGTSVVGTDPGFVAADQQDYRLLPGAPCTSAATSLHADIPTEHVPVDQYIRHQTCGNRPAPGTAPDIGAFEFVPGDADGDLNVTISDFAWLYPCLTGPDVPIDTSCDLFNLDVDSDVDLIDFVAFLESMNL